MPREQPLSALLVIGMHKGSLALGIHMRCVWSSRFVKKFEGEKRKMERKGKERKGRDSEECFLHAMVFVFAWFGAGAWM